MCRPFLSNFANGFRLAVCGVPQSCRQAEKRTFYYITHIS